MPEPQTLTLGVAQTALEASLEANRDQIVALVRTARAAGCRVVVFPEGALFSPPGTPRAHIDQAVAAIQDASRESGIYVLFGLGYKRTDAEKEHQRLLVIDPEGRAIQTYDKLWYDARFPNVPGVFYIDGIPCAATICADRWIRGVEELPAAAGARILFECSGNYANEWIPDLEWYWYVPRALRNGVYVVFTNTARDNRATGTLGHGHSAVIAPDGSLLETAGEETGRLLVARLDLSRATGAEARRRAGHPLLRTFWETGLRILRGESAPGEPLQPLTSPEVPITLAAAQMACSRDVELNLATMERLIREAKAGRADVVLFPELSLTGAQEAGVRAATAPALASALARLQAAARREEIAVVFGMPWVEGATRRNSAFAIGPAGVLLTRYDQVVVDRPDLFTPGKSTQAMWLRVKGVPAVVTIGREALWSEIAEMAAVRGAQVHLHLAYDRDTGPRATLLRRQVWANLASYRTFTATVNAASPAGTERPSAAADGGSAIWEDFHRARGGRAGGYAPHSAVRLAEAGSEERLLFATQTVARTNVHFRVMTEKTNPQMRPWYEAGARAVWMSGGVEE